VVLREDQLQIFARRRANPRIAFDDERVVKREAGLERIPIRRENHNRQSEDDPPVMQKTFVANHETIGPYRSRTDTPLRELDFESSASANSAKGPMTKIYALAMRLTTQPTSAIL